MGKSQSTIMAHEITKSEQEWKEILSPEEYRVIRQKGTEQAGTGDYDKFYPKEEGHFSCRACGNPLYSAQSKFDSGCGWPAFDKCYKDSVDVFSDKSFGMTRQEIVCRKCGGHLGHVFKGERMTASNERHCVNSVSVKYVKGTLPMAKEEEIVTARVTNSNRCYNFKITCYAGN